jgi:hypothetical protein
MAWDSGTLLQSVFAEANMVLTQKTNVGIQASLLCEASHNRKNFLFFKTEKGAAVGDMFHSFIHTSELSGVNSHDYLTALLNHSASVRTKPQEWMPWNYKDTISYLPSRPPP